MFVSVFVSKDSKMYLYTASMAGSVQDLDKNDSVPEQVKDKFKTGRYICTVNVNKKKLVQIKNQDEFIEVLKTNGFYFLTVDENEVENQIKKMLEK
ncbi:YcgL domain-containing protein [Psittacicella hinzii]|uniref:YcgL domain-containing protein n=1 Tax=Psittacicella hinzii TaxID=2028575 RepID=UPI00361F4AE0